MFGKKYFVYILAHKRNGSLYVGVTNDLKPRVAEHRQGILPGLTKKYKIFLLVYYEALDEPRPAIAREKQLKTGSRANKIRLIKGMNPGWDDLFCTERYKRDYQLDCFVCQTGCNSRNDG
ncbi:GIY-YIG nuclease family protein [candidate division TA06 bacterium]|uniref:GIY-YIG nuclease family protein n=1 Tax=candidate division TA06 bacterium TaxID=2250710 RepID=A0A933MHU9_UNCT6|nr:GIY-YIG nuclease family protein [candidate division TA06 bacterium]